MSKDFEYDNCNIYVAFVPADDYGADRFFYSIDRPMCKNLSGYLFLKTIEDACERAKEYTGCVRPVCG